jgi:hypothetical protein
MASQITIAAAAGTVSSGPITIPDGTRHIRVEAILSDADFNAGKIVAGNAVIEIGGQTNTLPWTNVSGPIGNGEALTGQIVSKIPFPSGASVSGSLTCTNDSACQIGAIVSFADSPDDMPPTQRTGG